jgi:hypothetical protein
MAKVAAMEEMYLIYQAFINYLAGIESWGDFEPRSYPGMLLLFGAGITAVGTGAVV